MGDPAPVLISLPHGFNASGVTTWAVRLVNAMADTGRPCALVVHGAPAGQRAIEPTLHPGVDVVDARALAPLDACAGDLGEFLPSYRLALDILGARSAAPVVALPNLVGDSWGLMAALSRERPGRLRVVSVHHADTRYNDAVAAHYEPVVAAFVGVSDLVTGRLRASLPARHTDIYGIACGVDAPPVPRPRPSLADRPLRLVYTGRLDHEQKRVGALIAMSDALTRRAVPHELAVLGDGPALAAMHHAAATRPSVRLFGAVGPAEVTGFLSGADLFVLPSRYEGLSVSMLEAMAHGAVPLVTPSRSGTAQLVTHGVTGIAAAAGPDDAAGAAGEALADAIGAIPDPDASLGALRFRAWRLVSAKFSARLSALRYAALFDRVAAAGGRVWPAHRPPAFTGDGAGASGTLPAEGAPRLRELLAQLSGRRIAVWGTGRHTIELRAVLEGAPVEIAAFIDDDPNRHGATLWDVPIVAPDRAPVTGATDVVISSWLHQDDMWGRRGALEAGGLRVHRLYSAAA